MKISAIDKFIILLFYLSIIIGFYFNCLSQSSLTGLDGMAPIPVLLFPFAVSGLQIVRLGLFMGKCKLETLGRSWLYIFVYYILAFVIGIAVNQTYKYSVYWTMVIPPIAWFYFSIICQKSPYIRDFLIEWGFLFFIAFSVIAAYFIPRSILFSGFFASLNTGYYVLLSYPLAMLSKSKIKKIVCSVIMIVIVLLSMKRGGILAAIVGFVLYILLSKKNGRFGFFSKMILAVVLVGGLFYAVPVINDISGGTLEHRIEFTLEQGDEEGRASMYPKVWRAAINSPIINIIFGHGHEAVVRDKVVEGLSAHNDYLEFFYDFGIIGLILLLSFHIKLIKMTISMRRFNMEFLPMVFTLSSILVLSLVSIVYSYQYFLLVIPFLCLMSNELNVEKKREK